MIFNFGNELLKERYKSLVLLQKNLVGGLEQSQKYFLMKQFTINRLVFEVRHSQTVQIMKFLQN